MNLIVIYERDEQDGEEEVIGVADSVDNAKEMMKEYYGEYKVIEEWDIRDSGIEYSYKISVDFSKHGDTDDYRYFVTLYDFTLNEVL